MKKQEKQNEFIQKINFVSSQCMGHEVYGSTTEFYDEDGIVLMTVTEEPDGKLIFSFSDSFDELYEYRENTND